MAQFASRAALLCFTFALMSSGALAFVARGGPPSDAVAIANGDSVVAIVVLQNDGRRGLCTGTLISNSLVLTAAHCFTPGLENLGLDLPHVSVRSVYVCFKRDLTGIVMRSFDLSNGLCRPALNYKTNQLEDRDVRFKPSDLAIVSFGGGLPAARVPLPIFYGDLMKNEKCLSLGYGIVDSVEHAGRLNSLYERVDSQNLDFVVAHANLEMGENTHGDSGGPLLTIREGKSSIAGVISTTNRIVKPTLSIFTSPQGSEGWIKKTSLMLAPMREN